MELKETYALNSLGHQLSEPLTETMIDVKKCTSVLIKTCILLVMVVREMKMGITELQVVLMM